jgi:hypothetical protein
MKKNLLILVALVSLFASCKKEDEVNHITVSEETKKYFNYLPGSYWIYADSATGVLDSFVVFSNEFSTSLEQYGNTDRIDIGCLIFNGLGGPVDTLHFTLTNDVVQLGFSTMLSGGSPIVYPLTYYPFKLQMNNSERGPYPDFVTIVSQLLMGGKEYINALMVHAYKNDSQYHYDDWLYVTRDEGIVRLAIDHPNAGIKKAWELKSWNILR